MGFMDKLMFWKKDEFSFDNEGDFGKDMGLPSANDPLGNPDLGAPGLSDFSNDASSNPNAFGAQGSGNAGMNSMGANDFNNNMNQNPMAGMPRPRIQRAPEIRPVEQESGYGQGSSSQSGSGANNKELELISVKLDSIRNTLEIMNQRIARIERIAEGEQEQRKWV